MDKQFFKTKESVFEQLYKIDLSADILKKATHRIRMFYTLGQDEQVMKDFSKVVGAKNDISKSIDILRLKDDAFLRRTKNDD